MNSSPSSVPPVPSSWPSRWQRLSAATVRGFHRYGGWLVGISWKKFLLLSLLLIILANVVQALPPFSWRVTETIENASGQRKPPAAEPARRDPVIRIEKSLPGASEPRSVHITIGGKRVVTITDSAGEAASSPPVAPASAASLPAVPPVPPVPAPPPVSTQPGGGVVITLPPGAQAEEIREAVREAVQDAQEAVRDAQEAAREAEDAEAPPARVLRTRVVRWGDFLTDLALIWIVASAIIKITYRGRIQAEVKAAQATETAEAESLKRQVVEARMAAMQAQIEPHFLFNTLASIDHLIETDPARASQMQKHLIALLRASMPSMREANGNGSGGTRDLGRELEVIRPYLEILKVRMEDRLATSIEVPEGLQSAEFPPMMIQTLVENAIKHGLEPKPEGGSIAVKAEIVHGRLAVTVADTGLGFGQAPTAGTGVGLANIRERLQLLYGTRAALTVAENPGGGTKVTITVPYKTVKGASS